MATLPKAGLKLATQADVDGRHQRKAQKVPKTMRSVFATLIDIYPSCRSFIEMHHAKHINLKSSTDKVCIICIQARVHTLLVVYILLARVSTLRRSTIDRFSASFRFRYDLQRHNTLASSSSSTLE